MPDAPAEPFMTIRHAITGEVTTTGCAVLQLTLTAKSQHLPGTTLLHLPKPSSAPAAIAKAATDAIRRTR
ncbi:hypothetical protein ACFVP0_10000 [Streptomyces cinereoruber]|uniref:hypothetical protein n=1 Tax=Streptomyces cinereoruber TaxID=67260 RepID=UPI00368D063D